MKKYEKLNLLFDKRLAEEEKQKFLEEVKSDPQLSQEYSELLVQKKLFQKVFSDTKVLREEKPDQEFLSALFDRIERFEASEVPEKRRGFSFFNIFSSPAFGVGFAVVILIFTFLYIFFVDRTEPIHINKQNQVKVVKSIDNGKKSEKVAFAHHRSRRMNKEKETKIKYTAVVDSYEVEKGVVIVDSLAGSKKHPLIIWHFVNNE